MADSETFATLDLQAAVVPPPAAVIGVRLMSFPTVVRRARPGRWRES